MRTMCQCGPLCDVERRLLEDSGRSLLLKRGNSFFPHTVCLMFVGMRESERESD